MYTKKLAKDKHTIHQLSYTKKYKIIGNKSKLQLSASLVKLVNIITKILVKKIKTKN